jgi:protein O-GlcNAc transferase
MYIAKNEEVLASDPHFAECYGNIANAYSLKKNMANAWKVV